MSQPLTNEDLVASSTPNRPCVRLRPRVVRAVTVRGGWRRCS